MSSIDRLVGSKSPLFEEGVAVAPPDQKKMKLKPVLLTDRLPQELWLNIIGFLPVNDLMRFTQVSKDIRCYFFTILREPSHFARIILEVSPNLIRFACSSLLRQVNPSQGQLIEMVRVSPDFPRLNQNKSSEVLSYRPIEAFKFTPINIHALVLDRFFGPHQTIKTDETMTPSDLDFLLSKLPELEDHLGLDLGQKPQPGYVTSNVPHYIRSASVKTFSLLIHFLVKRYLNPIGQLWKDVLKNAPLDRQEILFDILVNHPTIILEKGSFIDGESHSSVVIRLDQIFYGSKGPLSGNGVLKDMHGNDFKGQFKDGKPFDAEVRYKDLSKNVFYGSYKEGIPVEGSGKIKDEYGRILNFGRLTEGRRHRLQKVVFPNGDACIGPFEDGKCKGRGTYRFADSSKYDGALEDFRPNGKGKRVDPNGNSYEGDFKDGLFHGRGTLQGPKGSIKGDFRDGKPNGQCVYTFPDCSSYEGEVHDKKYHGKGVFRTSHSVHDGNFIDGKRNGHFEVTYFNKLTHSGLFKDNKPDGVHQVTTSEGESYTVEYSAGKFWNGKFRVYRPDGSYELKYYRDGQEASITPLSK